MRPPEVRANVRAWLVHGSRLKTGEREEVLSAHAPAALPIHILRADGARSSAKLRAVIDLPAEWLRGDPALN